MNEQKAELLKMLFEQIMSIGPTGLGIYEKQAHGPRESNASFLGGEAGSQLTRAMQQTMVQLMEAYNQNDRAHISEIAKEIEGFIMSQVVVRRISEQTGYQWIDELRSIVKG